MKTYEFNLKHDKGIATIRIKESNLGSAQKTLQEIEKCPLSAIQSWRVVPTKSQIRKTQNLMRGL